MASAGGIVIRESRSEDFADWFRLYEAVAAEGRWIGGEAPSDREARRRSFDANLADPDAASFLAEVDGRMIGSLGVTVHLGIAELGMLVDSGWRGQGVGSALLEACISWARDHAAHKIVLEVWPHNLAARGLYAKFGFEEEGLFRRHYRRRNGQLWDAVRMALVLDHESPGSPFGTADKPPTS
jgi:putative acetyltransferase